MNFTNLLKKNKLRILIPARKGSKGFPYKNRLFLDRTINQIPEELRPAVRVSTNDSEIMSSCVDYNISYIQRPEYLCRDKISTKQVVQHFISSCHIEKDTLIVLMYITYPKRTWKDVQRGKMLLQLSNAKSLLCKVPVDTHPFLCFYAEKENRGRSIVEHDLYRRQDYPEVFRIEHFVSMFYASELPKLSSNLYNDETVYLPLSKPPMNVDILEDIFKND